MQAANSVLDVLIIGGGPAGLSVATGLARQLYTAAVFDSGVYRNELAAHMHNVVTWDHRSPADFRKKARDDILKRYSTIQFQSTRITNVSKTAEGQFEAKDDQGKTWLGRKLILATGVQDIYPAIDGYKDCWAIGIFHCLFCHGFEDRGAATAGVLAVGDMANPHGALHLARMAKRLAGQVTIYTDGASQLGDQLAEMAVGGEVLVDKRPIARLEKGTEQSQVIMHFKDGDKLVTGFLVHKPKTQVNGPFVEQLSLELTDQGDIKTTPPFYESSVPGVFAVGDCATPLKAVTQAVAMGSFGAGGLAGQLQVPVPAETASKA